MSLTKFTAAFAVLAVLSVPSVAQTQDTEKDAPVDHSQMEHKKMDHSQMDHSQMEHKKMDHSQMDHSQMEHSNMDHANMDHSAHDMTEMEPMESVMPMATDAPLITAKVNGLVCDFCAQALKKVFKKEDAVENIKVDLDAGEVVIALKPGGELEDAQVTKLIRKSGYSLVSIDRKGGA